MSSSTFSGIAAAPPDPILGLTEAFNRDERAFKVNLGVGVYQDAIGKVPILKVVHEAERRLLDTEISKTYIPIDGAPVYNKQVQQLLLGEDSPVIDQGRAITVQALGGTGGLKIGADFLRRFFPNARVHISTPSWENHQALFESAGFEVLCYPYYDPSTHGLNFEAMLSGLQQIPTGDVVVLHACCHNPTGVDLDPNQWDAVIEVLLDRGLIPFLDFAYQGFAVDVEADGYAVRRMAESGLSFLVSNSFSKSFSLYRERVGAFTLVTASKDEAARSLSQVKRIVRTNYSSPASHGAQVVALVLSDSELRADWLIELAEMRNRIKEMRSAFVEGLKAAGLDADFEYIREQRGMFSYSGLKPEVVRRLRDEYAIYVVESGRICVAALNLKNLPTVCAAIAAIQAN